MNNTYKNILAIETTCDETAAAIVVGGTRVMSSVVASSSEVHRKWGGIVPEVAAREQLKSMIPVLSESLKQSRLTIDDVDAIAVSVGPGLIGSLLVGVESAKTLAFVTGKPLIPVNHVIAHMYANFLQNSTAENSSRAQPGDNNKKITFPAVSLVVSGGHTELYLMESPQKLRWLGGTIDDAAGEAFDKTARLLGFENRGGAAIEQAAFNYKLSATSYQLRLPRPYLPDQPFNFSFSGLKTAIVREVHALKEKNQWSDQMIQHLAYEVQESIADVLVRKTVTAVEQYHATSILLSGGVSANKRIREKFVSHLPSDIVRLFAPPLPLCTDNAVTIGSYAFFLGKPTDWRNIDAQPDLTVEIDTTLHEDRDI